MRRCGFTLLEMMAVVVLLGLLAGAVGWSMAQDARRAARTDAVGQIGHADRLARLAAQRFGRPCVLRIDLREQTLRRIEYGPNAQPEAAHTVTLSKSQRIAEVLVGRSTARLGNASRPPAVTSGAVDVAYSRDGRSASYAIRLASGGTQQWLIVSGLTGQITIEEYGKDIHNLLRPGATRRPDAR